MTDLRCALLLAGLLALAPAQSIFDAPTPPGMPTSGIDSEIFSTTDAVALAGPGQIHRWVGLPGTPSHGAIYPTGALAMAGCGTPSSTGDCENLWSRLSDTMAGYRSVGPDLVAGSPDDELILVVGLPRNIYLAPTGITGVGDAWTPVNPTTAVQVDVAQQELRVLRFSPAGITLQTVTSPFAFDDRGWGRISEDAFVILGPGSDLTPATADDLALVLGGLSSGTAILTPYALPSGTEPVDFVVTETGVPCCLTPYGPVQGGPFGPAQTQLLLTFLRFQGGSLASDTLVASPPVYGFPLDYSIESRVGDTVIATIHDDMGPGDARSLVAGVSTTPTEIGGWYDDWNWGGFSRQVSETEVVHAFAFGLEGFTLHRYFPGGFDSFAANVPGASFNHLTAFKPRGDTLLVAADDFYAPHNTTLFIVNHLWAGNDLTTLTAAGTLNSYAPIPMGPGMVGLRSSSQPYGASFDNLRMVTFPTAQIVAPGVASGLAAPVDFAAIPATPVLGTPQVLQVTYPAAWNASAFLAVSLTLQSQPVPLTAPFASGSQLQLGLDGLLPELSPLNPGPGQAQLTIDPWGLVGMISGRPFYLQAAVLDGLGTVHLGPALMIVFH